MYYLWITAYLVLVFFCLLNFLLAIIVDGYAKVKETVTECTAESSVWLDLFSTLWSIMKRYRQPPATHHRTARGEAGEKRAWHHLGARQCLTHTLN